MWEPWLKPPKMALSPRLAPQCLVFSWCSKRKKFEITENPKFQKKRADTSKFVEYTPRLYKRYGRRAKPAEEVTNIRLASVSIVDWVIFLRTKRKECRMRKIWPDLRVYRIIFFLCLCVFFYFGCASMVCVLLRLSELSIKLSSSFFSLIKFLWIGPEFR